MKTKTLLIGCMAALCMSACTSNDNRRVIDVVQEPEIEEHVDNFRHEAQPIALTRSQEDINTRLQDFSLQVFKQMYADKQAGDNVLFSPFSLNVALGMFANGLEGETLEQLLKTMNLTGFTVDDLNEYFQTMLKGVQEADDQVVFNCANSFWYHNRFNAMPSYAERLESYEAETREVNLDDVDEALKQINGWVYDKTEGKIPTILTKKHMEGFLWALINAIYYQGGWKHEFEESRTISLGFQKEDKTTQYIDLMRQTHMFPYQNYDGYQVARFPYNDGAFDFFVVLPYLDTDINEVINTFSINDLILSNESKLSVEMPKMKVDYTNDHLMRYLTELNPNINFNNGEDFNMLVVKATGEAYHEEEALEIIQKTYMEVDEKGAVAAAVTAIIGHEMDARPESVIDFHMDHPFLYGIIENSTNTPLFIGYYGN